MITDRKIAIQVLEAIMNIDALLTRITQIVHQSTCSEKEKKAFNKIVGKVTAILFIDTLTEILKIHPDIAPPSFAELKSRR